MKWNDIPGSLCVELTFDNTYGLVWYDKPVNPELTKKLLNIMADPELWPVDTGAIELVIDFKASGFDDEGRLYGPPERCYPACFDEERECTMVCLYGGKHEIVLDCQLAQECFGAFESEIYDVDIDREQLYDPV